MDFKKNWRVFLSLLVLFISCESAQITLALNKFSLEKKELDTGQSKLYGLMSGLPLSAISMEEVNGIPQNMTAIEYISLKVSHAADSLVTGLRAKDEDGYEVYYFDTNNNENFTDDSPLKMENMGDKQVLTVPLQFDELVEGKTVKRNFLLELLQTRNRPEYHILNYWRTNIFLSKDTLDIAVLRVLPDYPIMFVDSDRDGTYDRGFDVRSEILPVGGKFYEIQIDFPAESVMLLETEQQPVDVGYSAPLFDGRIWQAQSHFKLAEQQGKVTFLLFGHPDCGGTTKCMPSLTKMRNEFVSSENIKFISISRDSSEVMKYHSKYDFQFESIIDSEIWQEYGAIITPTIFIIDGNGIIRHRKSGASADEGELLGQTIRKLLNQWIRNLHTLAIKGSN